MVGGNAVFTGTAATADAPMTAGPLPLVVLSHGGLRSAPDSGAWLGASLAQAGFIVVEVNASRPENAATAANEIWQRPRDISRALDMILGTPAWADHVDRDRLSVIGFALGGTAALSLTGSALDMDAYARSCTSGEAPAPDCAWFAARNVTLDQVDPGGFASLKPDPRLSAAIILEPEYPAVLKGGTVPTLLVSLSAEPVAVTGRSLETIAIPEATGFDAFATCTQAGPEILLEEDGDPALCGTSAEARAHVHDAITGAIRSFLAEAGSR